MIIAFSDLPAIRKKHSDKKLVAASGVFDLLHTGHIRYLQSLKNYGDVNVVMIKPDARIKHFKHPNRPVIPEADRAKMVNAIKGVDYVVIGSSDLNKQARVDALYEDFFDLLRPDAYVSTNEDWARLAEITEARMHILPRRKAGRYESTTAILKHISRLDSF